MTQPSSESGKPRPTVFVIPSVNLTAKTLANILPFPTIIFKQRNIRCSGHPTSLQLVTDFLERRLYTSTTSCQVWRLVTHCKGASRDVIYPQLYFGVYQSEPRNSNHNRAITTPHPGDGNRNHSRLRGSPPRIDL